MYLSPDGRGFDGGSSAFATELTLTGLTPGATLYLQVTAVNAGGESLPSETLALRTPERDEPTVLLVPGFDRLDQHMLVEEHVPELAGSVQRMFLEQMNRFDYVVEHTEALRDLGVAVESASNEAVAAGRVALDPDSHAAGGSLLASGAEIGWDLDHLGDTADRAFFRDVLRAVYVADVGECAAGGRQLAA